MTVISALPIYHQGVPCTTTETPFLGIIVRVVAAGTLEPIGLMIEIRGSEREH